MTSIANPFMRPTEDVNSGSLLEAMSTYVPPLLLLLLPEKEKWEAERKKKHGRKCSLGTLACGRKRG